MKRIIPSMKKQGIMFAEYYIDDRLPKDHEVYAFDSLVDTLDLSEITRSYSSEGGKMYSPTDMVKIILYAYLKGITSSYKIAEAVATSIPFIYLAGGHEISRRTICDFRRRNVTFLKEFFSSTVQTAIEIGLVDPNGCFFLDGSKFAANASCSKTRTKENWLKRREAIEKSVDKFLNQLEINDQAEEGIEEEREKKFKKTMEKINELKNKKTLSKTEQRKINRVERQIKEDKKIANMLEENPDLKNKDKINLTDNDSRLMLSGDGKFLQGYNAQIITSNQVIVAADVIQDENDQDALIPMVNKLEKELPKDAEYKLSGDAGYNKGENLKWLDSKKNIDAYISMRDRREDKKSAEEKEFSKDAFEYNEDEDCYICPEGKPLEYFTFKEKKDKIYSVYRGDINTCQRCSKRDKCFQTKNDYKAGTKIIEDDGTLVYRKEMRLKMSSEEAKRIYAERSVDVEPVFGQIKHNLGIRQFKMQGYTYLKGEFLLICSALNILKIMKYKMREKIA